MDRKLICALLTLCSIADGQAISAVYTSPQIRYVDANVGGAGNDANDGKIGSPWATLAHAASVAPGAKIRLKTPLGGWLPPLRSGWTALTSLMWGAPDIANGLVCTLTNASNAPHGGNFRNGGYASCGTNVWQINTGDLSVLAYTYVQPQASPGCCGGLLGHGYLASQPGWGLLIDSTGGAYVASAQIRTAGAGSFPTSAAMATNKWHNIGATFRRNSATGGQMHLDGTPSGSAVSTTALNGISLNSTQQASIGTRFSGGSPGLPSNAYFQGPIEVWIGTALSASQMAEWAEWNVAAMRQEIAEKSLLMVLQNGNYGTAVNPRLFLSADAGYYGFEISTTFTGATTPATRGCGNPTGLYMPQTNSIVLACDPTIFWGCDAGGLNCPLATGSSGEDIYLSTDGGATFSLVGSINNCRVSPGRACAMGGLNVSAPLALATWANLYWTGFADGGSQGIGLKGYKAFAPNSGFSGSWTPVEQWSGACVVSFNNVLVLDFSTGLYWFTSKAEGGDFGYKRSSSTDPTTFSSCSSATEFGAPAETISLIPINSSGHTYVGTLIAPGMKRFDWTPGASAINIATAQLFNSTGAIGATASAFSAMWVPPYAQRW